MTVLLKMNVTLDHEGYVPVDLCVGKEHTNEDVEVSAKTLPITVAGDLAPIKTSTDHEGFVVVDPCWLAFAGVEVEVTVSSS